MDGPERIETRPFPRTDKVQPTQNSEKDKRRKFARDLKEELEEDREQKRKRNQKDELVVESNTADSPEEQLQQDDQSEESRADNDEDGDDVRPEQTSGGIDIKA